MECCCYFSFPLICTNIPASPAYGVCISQLICYSRACAQYSKFLDRAPLLIQKLLKKGQLLIDWSHRYIKYTVVITVWLTAPKYPYLKWQWNFSFLRKCSSSTEKARIAHVFSEARIAHVFSEARIAHVFSEARIAHVFSEARIAHVFSEARIAHVFSVLYCVVYLCFVFVALCLVCLMLPVSLDCPFLTALSVFSDVYFLYF